jgi:hypothetical protein
MPCDNCGERLGVPVVQGVIEGLQGRERALEARVGAFRAAVTRIGPEAEPAQSDLLYVGSSRGEDCRGGANPVGRTVVASDRCGRSRRKGAAVNAESHRRPARKIVTHHRMPECGLRPLTLLPRPRARSRSPPAAAALSESRGRQRTGGLWRYSAKPREELALLGILDRESRVDDVAMSTRRRERSDDMFIRTRMGVSVDGFVATPDGVPVFVVMPGFVPHESYDWPAFDEQIDAVVLGRVRPRRGAGGQHVALAGQAGLRPHLTACSRRRPGRGRRRRTEPAGGCSSDCEPRACHATRSCSGDARPCTLSSRSAQSTGSSCSSFPSSWAKASPSHCPARQCGGWS